MAVYRLIHTRNDGTRVGTFTFSPIITTVNPGSFSGVPLSVNFDSLANNVPPHSNGTVSEYTQDQFYIIGSDWESQGYDFWNAMNGDAITNYMALGNGILAGDRFYLGIVRRSSYIEVSSINYTTGDYTLLYKTQGGTTVYTVTLNAFAISSKVGGCDCLPWIGNLNTPGNYSLTAARITYNDNDHGYYVSSQSGIYPSSLDNAISFWDNVIPVEEDNPYEGGEYSSYGGGDPHKQNWAENSDIVLPSPMPNETDFGAVACGLITIFTPSKQELTKLSEVLWGQGFWNFVQNAIENISDLFVSLAMVPFEVSKGATVEVTWFSYDVGGQVPIGTGIYLTKAANQWYEFDMGTINLTGTGKGFATDSVLDYSPFSKLGIYLPFIGYQELDIDECRESPINLKYRIDILSGTCVALITINGRTIYQFTGNCLTQLPLTSMDAQTMLSNAVNIGIAAASAGATAAVASAGDAMTAENLAKDKISATQAELQNAQHAASVSNAQGSLTSATANGILGMKPNFKKTGAVSASASLFNVMQPYLFLTTPRQSMPEGYEKVCGFPCNMGGTLGEFSGFTVVEDIRLNGLVATSPEVEEIYQLLKQGVII